MYYCMSCLHYHRESDEDAHVFRNVYYIDEVFKQQFHMGVCSQEKKRKPEKFVTPSFAESTHTMMNEVLLLLHAHNNHNDKEVLQSWHG
ncbi:DUF3973 domain-containing protein [Paenibacillus apiarius]|uniref:DUF3973 domain-containing protein n=1 Tax=Paenibacillus apiarius TaxID=46240 RepID=A0ABT4DU97_9BACL|nr:DUF3973 domain-containing protein [Paenibacillus apiarius]MBN3526934.1 DUF3973 domain-containing protein [Paenibacillus apiarius]MCY9516316.1 DUF3973 domain-containing protein [Paenibacillus apiarius]MCY9519586.1 DUF3973 domain-containing protein [Paenibacillus apiarius]MCY9554652.1 DUF3973 domain-containing protein [Paenibacillus apiarius]MCY9561521.1 DUF3973 domain-containing protein [Paenibacillus apiarius]